MSNDKLYTVTIDGQNNSGDGVGRIDGITTFIPGALKGEEVDLKILDKKRNYYLGELKAINKKSPYRVEPICPVYENCGGCDIMHYDYNYQLDFKQTVVYDSLTRIGGLSDIVVLQTQTAHNQFYYRNKVHIPIGQKQGQVVMGFYKRQTNEIVPFKKCYLLDEQSNKIVAYFKDLIAKYQFTAYDKQKKRGDLKHLVLRRSSENEFLIIIVTKRNYLPFSSEITNDIINNFGNIIKGIIHNVNPKDFIVLGKKANILYGQDYLIESILNLDIMFNYQSFMQINFPLTSKLYSHVINTLTSRKCENILDLYCGVGIMALLMARSAQNVYGVEVNSDAVLMAKNNAKLNNINNANFINARVEDVFADLITKNIDGVIIDPPRSGLDSTITQLLLQSDIKTICYVSCNPATLARDLKSLTQEYNIVSITPFDMFSQTRHIETVVFLSRIKRSS